MASFLYAARSKFFWRQRNKISAHSCLRYIFLTNAVLAAPFSIMAPSMVRPMIAAGQAQGPMETDMSRVRSSLARRCLVAATCGVFALVLAAPAAAREFRAADIQEENYPTVQALRYMDQLVTQRTGGRHRI